MNKVMMTANGDPAIFCPACRCGHIFDRRWAWNGSKESPTFDAVPGSTASHLVFEPMKDGSKRVICHSFIHNGNIEFCGDNPHELNGKTVPLPPFPGGYGGVHD